MSSGDDHDDGEIVIPDDQIKEPVTVACPDCGTTGDVPNWFLGNEMECKSCDFRFTVTPSEDTA